MPKLTNEGYDRISKVATPEAKIKVNTGQHRGKVARRLGKEQNIDGAPGPITPHRAERRTTMRAAGQKCEARGL